MLAVRFNRWMGYAAAAGSLLGLLALWNPTSPGQAPAVERGAAWEYKTLAVGVDQIVGVDPNSNEALNELGQGGWELVAATSDGAFNVFCIFKRQRQK